MFKPIEQIPERVLHSMHVALSKAGGDETHARWIRSGDNSTKLIRFIDEQRNLKNKDSAAGLRRLCNRLIDCDDSPYIPRDWEIRRTNQPKGAVGGDLEFDPAKIIFHLDRGQKAGRSIDGIDLYDRLYGKALLKANVLDHLLQHPSCIPEAWKNDRRGRIRRIHFWGTIYNYPFHGMTVRYLYWDDGEWSEGFTWIGERFIGRFDCLSPAAILVG